jgi:hypothetical protein
MESTKEKQIDQSCEDDQMSEVRGCIRCKKQFSVSILRTQFCNDCKEIKKIESNKVMRNSILNHDPIYGKCKWCKKIIKKSAGRKYCSHTCQVRYWNTPKYIKRAKLQIIKHQNRIEFLESLL